MTELEKQVWKNMEEMGWENAPEDFHLEYFNNIIECTKQALTTPVVVGQKELYTCECKICGEPLDNKEDYYQHYNTEHNQQVYCVQRLGYELPDY